MHVRVCSFLGSTAGELTKLHNNETPQALMAYDTLPDNIRRALGIVIHGDAAFAGQVGNLRATGLFAPGLCTFLSV
jgi:hypothetical protein